MGVSEVELLLTKHVSQRDESFEVWLSGDPPGGGGGGLAPSAPQTPVYLSDCNETFKNMF